MSFYEFSAINIDGKEVEVKIDRQLGTNHPKHGFVYEVNYGYFYSNPESTPADRKFYSNSHLSEATI